MTGVRPPRTGGPGADLLAGPEDAFDRYTRLAALLTGAPMSFLSLVRAGRTEWASAYGPGPAGPGPLTLTRDLPIDESLCGVVLAADDAVLVDDVGRDPASRDLAAVAELGIGAWAGFPVLDLSGHVLGTLCAMDVGPRAWSDHDRDVLATLARAASGEIALRAGLHHARGAEQNAARRAADSERMAEAARERARDALLEARRAGRAAEELQDRVVYSARRAETSDRDAEESRRLARLAEEHAAEADELAATLRESLLPARLADFPGLEVAARYRPGTGGSVLGDFYDLFPTPQGWGSVVGDVCGKGVQAARTTALARSTVRALGHTEHDPRTVLDALHGVLHVWFDRSPSFVTVAYAAMRPHPEGFAVAVASAGHPPAVVHRVSGDVQVLGAGGRALGVGTDAVIAVEEIVLRPGDRLLLYTDGVTEAHPPHGEQFEVEGIVGVLEGLAPGGSAAEAADAVVDAARVHAAGASTDDTAMMVLRAAYVPPPDGAKG